MSTKNIIIYGALNPDQVPFGTVPRTKHSQTL
jgi:hypothetical protein